MMTPKMKEDLCTQILNASRQLFLSSKISEVCQEKGTQKQLEFILELMNEELTLRDKNRRKRLIKRAGFPTYKTFEGYSYSMSSFLLLLAGRSWNHWNLCPSRRILYYTVLLE